VTHGLEKVMEHGPQYRLDVWETGFRQSCVFDPKEIHDPFHNIVVTPGRHPRILWAILRGRYQIHIAVRGTLAADRVVFTDDYTASKPVASVRDE